MIVGVTGGIGSGKSTILRKVAKLGYSVYDCDAEAKRIIATDPEARRQLIDTFGPDTFVNGIYNTRYIAAQVFAHPEQLARLNAIVHPAARQDILHWASDMETLPQIKPRTKTPSDALALPKFVESAILFQAGIADLCDGIAVVTVPVEERITRTMYRDRHASREDVERRIRAQHMPEEYLPQCTKPHILLLNDDETPHRYLVDQLLQFALSL